MGALIFTLLVGRPPFETTDLQATYKNIKRLAYIFPEHIPISDDAKDCIKEILQVEPHKRPNFDQILSLPFFKKYILPKQLPASTLAVPPTSSYIKQFEKPKILSFREIINYDDGSKSDRPIKRLNLLVTPSTPGEKTPSSSIELHDGDRMCQTDRPTHMKISLPEGRQTPRDRTTSFIPGSNETERISATPGSFRKKITNWSSYYSSDDSIGPSIWVKK